VQNRLLGRHGATRTFGPQKGATTIELALLEKCLKRLARVAVRQVRPVNPRDPGTGAAGGLGFGLAVFAGATLRPGFDIVAEIIGAESRVKAADVVITGEGRFDAQTLNGKGPAGIAHLARKHDKPVFAIVGEATQDQRKMGELFDAIHQLSSDTVSKADSIAKAGELLRKSAGEMAKSWQLS
jgi:glycerate kinase